MNLLIQLKLVVQAHETRSGMLGQLGQLGHLKGGGRAAIAFSNRVMRQPAPDTTQ